MGFIIFGGMRHTNNSRYSRIDRPVRFANISESERNRPGRLVQCDSLDALHRQEKVGNPTARSVRLDPGRIKIDRKNSGQFRGSSRPQLQRHQLAQIFSLGVWQTHQDNGMWIHAPFPDCWRLLLTC